MILKIDHTQVMLNGGPPCYYLTDPISGWCCGRALRWAGHDSDHLFVPYPLPGTVVEWIAR